jgi:hypothetical protein
VTAGVSDPERGDEARVRPRAGRAARALCALLGHSYPVRLRPRPGECACGADHGYPGCVRCGARLNVRAWWH